MGTRNVSLDAEYISTSESVSALPHVNLVSPVPWCLSATAAGNFLRLKACMPTVVPKQITLTAETVEGSFLRLPPCILTIGTAQIMITAMTAENFLSRPTPCMLTIETNQATLTVKTAKGSFPRLTPCILTIGTVQITITAMTAEGSLSRPTPCTLTIETNQITLTVKSAIGYLSTQVLWIRSGNLCWFMDVVPDWMLPSHMKHLENSPIHQDSTDNESEHSDESDVDDEPAVCHACERSFVNRLSLYQHLAASSKHNWCFVCSRDFSTNTALDQVSQLTLSLINYR